MKAGIRLGCAECTTEVIVVRAPEGDVTLTCGDVPFVEVDAVRKGTGHGDANGEGTLLGKRYADDEVGLELLCTKAGTGALACEGRPMSIKRAKPLPSSD
jgi:hypothetical protein